MQRFYSALMCWWIAAALVQAEEFKLADGQTLSGTPISYTDAGVVLKDDAGKTLARTPYAKFTQEAIKLLHEKARNAKEKAVLEPFLEEVIQENTRRSAIEIKPVVRLERPTKGTGFWAALKSPVGLTLLFLIYLGNLYAAYEVALFKRRPYGLLCGIAAAAPWITQIVFLCLPRVVPKVSQEIAEAQAAVEEWKPDWAAGAPAQEAIAEAAAAEAAVAAAQPAAPESNLPPTVTFSHSEFTFNRRFFESKLAMFLRAVPSEADKDMLLVVQSARGTITGRRLTRITPEALVVQVSKGEASADETIPFIEIREVSIKHKDAQ